MVNKTKMTTAVNALEDELSTSGRDAPSQPVQTDAVTPDSDENVDSVEDIEPDLHDVERLLEHHGLDTEELRGLWEEFLEELKDLPSTKPLLTAFGAFLLGYIAGRSSRK